MAKIDTSDWKEFTIGRLFKVVKGTRLTKAHMTPGDIRFIGSSAMNNGCTAMVCNTENMHPANTITVCYNGSVGETFYQDQPFLASDDVNVLYPKFDMSKEIALFIVPSKTAPPSQKTATKPHSAPTPSQSAHSNTSTAPI